MMQATAGSLTGIGEVVLLPLDALKIKRQVNPEAFRGRGAVRIFMEEGTTLYRGWGWTMARNAPGSFAVSLVYVVTRWDPLFFDHAVTITALFHLAFSPFAHRIKCGSC